MLGFTEITCIGVYPTQPKYSKSWLASTTSLLLPMAKVRNEGVRIGSEGPGQGAKSSVPRMDNVHGVLHTQEKSLIPQAHP